jgi:predicted  nucleic acid-binding Zn-ribbon protein
VGTAEQEALLAVQRHDTAIDQLRHRRETLPERGALSSVEADIVALEARAAGVREQRDELARREKALEDEIAGIEAKVADLNRRLYSGTIANPRELQALQADIDSLERRASELEDAAIALLEEREPYDAELAALDARRAELDGRAGELRARLAEAEAAIDAEIAAEKAARDEAAAGVGPALLARYEELRARLGGVGAARLEPGGRCGGCNLQLPAVEVARIKREPPDAVVCCDLCGRILVRPDTA